MLVMGGIWPIPEIPQVVFSLLSPLLYVCMCTHVYARVCVHVFVRLRGGV